jgi:hypothetical protein
VDATRAVSGAITSAGGTLTATAADGTRFTLAVPADALMSPETITMTPLSSVDGAPLGGGMVGGVKLEPEGLRLLKTATLTVAPTAPVSVGEEEALGYHADGNDAHRHPVSRDGNDLVLPLDHFSGYVVGKATQVDRQSIAQHLPPSIEDQITQIRAALAHERACQLAGADSCGESDTAARIVSLLEAQWEQQVYPLLQRAETEDSLAVTAIATANEWARTAQLLNLEQFNDQQATIVTMTRAILENAYSKARERCRVNHDLTQIVRMGAVARALALMNWSDKVSSASYVQDLEACVQFELDVSVTDEAHMQDTTDAARCGRNCVHVGLTGYDVKTHAEIQSVKLRMAAGALDGIMRGEGTISYPTFEGQLQSSQWSDGHMDVVCHQAASGVHISSPFRATLQLDLNLKDAPTGNDGLPSALVPKIRLVVDPGQVEESFTGQFVDGKSCSPQTTTFQYYNQVWKGLTGKSPKYDPPYEIDGWTYAGGATWATRAYHWDGSRQEDHGTHVLTTSGTMDLSLTLRHTPVS